MLPKSAYYGYATEQFSSETHAAYNKISFADWKGELDWHSAIVSKQFSKQFSMLYLFQFVI